MLGKESQKEKEHTRTTGSQAELDSQLVVAGSDTEGPS